MDDIVIQSHKGSYTVRFDRAFAGLQGGLARNEHLIIDERVAELYSEVLGAALAGPSVLRIEATESNKSLEQFPDYVTHLLNRRIRRDHVLIAVGGGVIQDITAFVAGTLFRGLPWRFYPTTLLAQADSCIGSKSSVNVGQYKNQLGTFTPPSGIVISTSVLDSLSERDVRSGIGEMIKVHIISGWEDTRAIARDYGQLAKDKQCMAHYIDRSLQIKKVRIEADEFDRNERLVMNYGHSFGHAIESATHYAVPHGIAVTIGMDMANFLSLRYGLIDHGCYEELRNLLAQNYVGFEHIPIPADGFFSALLKDKKNVGVEISLILMRAPGQVFRGRYSPDEEFDCICREYFQVLRKRVVPAAL